jgi:hypothetical protein
MINKQTLENTEGTITNGQSRETGNARQRQTIQKHKVLMAVKKCTCMTNLNK